MEIIKKNIEQLVNDPENARRHDLRNLDSIVVSLQKFGQQKPIVVTPENVVVAGNGTLMAARELGWETIDAVVTTLKGDALKAYAIADNRSAELAEWDIEVLLQQHASLDDEMRLATGFADDEIQALAKATMMPLEEEPPLDEGEGEEEEKELNPEGREESDDGTNKFVTFPGDPEYGIPTLDMDMQATSLPSPIMKWGAISRSDAMFGTYHFYTHDYKFNNIWMNPAQLVNTGCKVAVEANFSITEVSPAPWAIWCVYRKRLLARYWQSKGVRILVDLDVNPSGRKYFLLGVPRGWGAYATRLHKGGETSGLVDVEEDHAVAMNHSEGKLHLFLVVGGDRTVQEWCAARAHQGVVWNAPNIRPAINRESG